MNRSTRNYDNVAFFYHERIAAFDRFTSPFTRRDLGRFDKLAAQSKRRLPRQNVVDIVGRIMQLEHIVLALFIVEKRHSRLHAFRRNNVTADVARLLS